MNFRKSHTIIIRIIDITMFKKGTENKNVINANKNQIILPINTANLNKN
jgi:hypothetical protein